MVDGLERGLAVEAGGGGDGAVAGVDLGTPIRAEAAGDLAEHHGGADFPLAGVVGGRDPVSSYDSSIAREDCLLSGTRRAGRQGGKPRVHTMAAVARVLRPLSSVQVKTSSPETSGAMKKRR